jgi:hypothetical protein
MATPWSRGLEMEITCTTVHTSCSLERIKPAHEKHQKFRFDSSWLLMSKVAKACMIVERQERNDWARQHSALKYSGFLRCWSLSLTKSPCPHLSAIVYLVLVLLSYYTESDYSLSCPLSEPHLTIEMVLYKRRLCTCSKMERSSFHRQRPRRHPASTYLPNNGHFVF